MGKKKGSEMEIKGTKNLLEARPKRRGRKISWEGRLSLGFRPSGLSIHNLGNQEIEGVGGRSSYYQGGRRDGPYPLCGG